MLWEDYNSDPAQNVSPPPVGAPEQTTKLKNTNEIDRRMMAAINEIGQWVQDRFDGLGTMADQDATQVAIEGGIINNCSINNTNTISATAIKTGILPIERIPVPVTDSTMFAGWTAQQWYNIIFPIGSVKYLLAKRSTFPTPPPGVTATWSFISTVRYPKCLPFEDYTGTPSAPQVGGATTGTTVAGGGHDHSGKVNPTTLTLAQMPRHRHGGLSGATATGQTTGYRSEATVQNSGAQQTDEQGSSQPHDHGIPPVADHTHDYKQEPAWIGVQMWVRTA